MGNQDGLRQVPSKFLVAPHDPFPEPGGGFAESFLIELIEVSPNFEPLVHPEGFQLADRDAADQLAEGLFAKAAVNVRDFHEVSGYHEQTKPIHRPNLDRDLVECFQVYPWSPGPAASRKRSPTASSV